MNYQNIVAEKFSQIYIPKQYVIMDSDNEKVIKLKCFNREMGVFASAAGIAYVLSKQRKTWPVYITHLEFDGQHERLFL